MEFNLLSSVFNVYNESGNVTYSETFEFERNNMFLQEMQEFISCIEEKRNTFISFNEGKKSLEMAMAVKESMKTGKPVEFEKFINN